MADAVQTPPAAPDPSGIPRTPDGTIADPKTVETPETSAESETTQPDTTTAEPDGTSLLTKKDEEAPAGAPEKYEDFKLPEGFEANPEMMTKAQAAFKSLNLSQEQAQSLIDVYAEQAVAAAEAPVNYYNEMRAEWVKQVNADPEIGGAKLKETKLLIGKAIDAHLPGQLGKDFRQAMDFTGAGDHPAFVKAMLKMATLLTEGTSVRGGGPSPDGQRAPGAPKGPSAASMYPNLPSSSR